MTESKENSKVVVKKAKKSQAVVTSIGRAYITSTFNNTLITITNDKGDPIAGV